MVWRNRNGKLWPLLSIRLKWVVFTIGKRTPSMSTDLLRRMASFLVRALLTGLEGIWKCCLWLKELPSLRELGNVHVPVWNSSCPSLSGFCCTAFCQHLDHYLTCIYLFISHLGVLAVPPSQVKALGTGALGLLFLSTSVELRKHAL